MACVDQIFPHSPNTFSSTRRKKANLFRKMICLLFLFHCAAGVLSSSTREYMYLSLSLIYICVLHVFLYLLHRIWFVSEFDAFSVELKFVNRIDRKLKLQYSVN